MGTVRRLAATLAVVALTSGCAWVGRVGVASNGAQPASGTITGTDVSPNGRYVVFTTEAAGLVANDTNDAPDVFLRDAQTGTTERVSVATGGAQAGAGAYGGAVSADGRFVAFTSDSTNLIAGDTNGVTDVFLRDRTANTTIRVSVRNGGGQADDASFLTSMTSDATKIVFSSDATNLIGTDVDQNFSTDVFVRDLSLVKTQRISVGTDGSEGDVDSTGGSISDDGRYVVFLSNASTFDAEDSGVYQDAYLRDRTLATTTRISVAPDGTETDSDTTNALISGDGGTVALESDATNLVDPAVDGLQTQVYAAPRGSTTFDRASVATDGGDPDDYTFLSGISDDGRFVLFQGGASNLVGDTLLGVSNSFVRDRVNHTTVLAGTSQRMGEPRGASVGQAGSTPHAISGDGRYVLFSTTATDVLAAGDTNGAVGDLYLRSNPVPFIFFASPNTVTRGTATTIALHGWNLHGEGALALMGDGISVTGVTAVGEDEIDVAVVVAADAAVGKRTPLIVQTGTGGGLFSGGLVFLPDAITVV